MHLPPIYWTQFTWEAFATLASGLSAVGAAVVIGLRQVAISNRQSEILQRQVELAHLNTKIAVFDRRMDVYRASLDFIISVMRGDDDDSNPKIGPFLTAMDEATFLFTTDVHARLHEVWAKRNSLLSIRKQMKALYEREQHYGPFPDQELELSLWMDDRMKTLNSIFGDDLLLRA
jgi:hypothetical protein